MKTSCRLVKCVNEVVKELYSSAWVVPRRRFYTTHSERPLEFVPPYSCANLAQSTQQSLSSLLCRLFVPVHFRFWRGYVFIQERKQCPELVLLQEAALVGVKTWRGVEVWEVEAWGVKG